MCNTKAQNATWEGVRLAFWDCACAACQVDNPKRVAPVAEKGLAPPDDLFDPSQLLVLYQQAEVRWRIFSNDILNFLSISCDVFSGAATYF